MKQGSGIAFYITSRLVLLFALFAISYSFLANHLYLWGMDEATAYYMTAEAEIVLENYNVGEPIEEQINGYREYYWPDRLPDRYQQQFKPQPDDLNKLLLFQHSGVATYLMPIGTSKIELYVIHILPNVSPSDETTAPVRQMLIAIALTALLLVALLACWFVYRLVSATMALSLWAGQLNAAKSETLVVPSKAKMFNELKFLAQRLSQSFNDLARFNEREQQFLRSLSHELRTPIAVTSAALDVLDKKAPEGMSKLLARIRRASNSMRSLTETVLWLWRDPQNKVPNQAVCLHRVVKLALVDNRHLLKNKQVEVANQVSSENHLFVDETLLGIVCNNLIRNAFQHCDEGKITLIAQDNCLTVINSVGAQGSKDTGFGLGLLIVQRIVEKQNWQLLIKNEQNSFKVSVNFSSRSNM